VRHCSYYSYFFSLFLYAATVCRYVGKAGPNRTSKRLTHACSPDFQPRSDDFAIIDSLYRGILAQALDKLDTGERAGVDAILNAVTTLQDSLPVSSISRLLGLDGPNSVLEELDDLHSVVVLPETADGFVSIFHTMFVDFLRDEARSKPYHFPSSRSNYLLAEKCLVVLDGNLKNIFRSTAIVNLPTTSSMIGRAEIDAAFPSEVQYAVLHVIDHIVLSGAAADLALLKLIYSFYHNCYIEWVQCLSILGRLSKDSHWARVSQHFKERDLDYMKICRHLSNISRLVDNPDTLKILKEFWREIPAVAMAGSAKAKRKAQIV
jgi:hypothetical protein